MSENNESQGKVSSRIQISALVIAAATIAVTIFFSVRAERTKSMIVTYTAKRPLVSLETGRRSVGMEITYGGKRIEMPWLLSGRLENSGNQPIEERDIEVPANISFTRGNVVGAEIAQKSQTAIFAEITAKANNVVIEHKLLNPGDWIDFDILFDGEPDMPFLSFRISGVSQPKHIVVSQDSKRVHTSIIPLPLPIMYLLLGICTLISLSVTGAGLFILGGAVRKFFIDPSAKTLNRMGRASPDPSKMAKYVTPKSINAKAVYLMLKTETLLEWLDDPNTLRNSIIDKVPLPFLESLGLSIDHATTMLVDELRAGFKEQIVLALFSQMPRGVYSKAQGEFLKIDASALTSSQLLENARMIVKDASTKIKRRGFRERLELGDIIGGISVMVLGLLFVVILGGTWRTIIGI